MSFPLDQWFDITKTIGKEDVEDCKDQMLLYSYKDGEHNSSEYKSAIKDLLQSVKLHNQKFKGEKTWKMN